MLTRAIGLAIATLAASATFGQNPAEQGQDRTFYPTHGEIARELQEIATVIRSITDIRQLFTDIAQKSVAVHGTAGQIATAAWLVNELDQSATGLVHEYRLSSGDENVVRVFYLMSAEIPQEVQEVVTLVRAMTGVQRAFIYNAPKAVVLRGTADQMALAEWLVKELDQPADAQPGEYRLPGASQAVVRVFFLTHAESPHDRQQVAVRIRLATNIRRIFIYDKKKALAMRGTPDQIAAAERLIQ